jgi:glycosyltransferase involved in cell wall biosynthesis
MACGLPVVATEVGGIPDIVEPDRTGLLVPKGDSPKLADALAALLADSGRRARMGEAAYAYAQEHFDARKTAMRLVELYRELISASRDANNAQVGVGAK